MIYKMPPNEREWPKIAPGIKRRVKHRPSKTNAILTGLIEVITAIANDGGLRYNN
jgi:hypothetical protein